MTKTHTKEGFFKIRRLRVEIGGRLYSIFIQRPAAQTTLNKILEF